MWGQEGTIASCGALCLEDGEMGDDVAGGACVGGEMLKQGRCQLEAGVCAGVCVLGSVAAHANAQQGRRLG